MKYTLATDKTPSSYWNGEKPLPSTIHVISHSIHVAELELLTILCTLHGKVSAFDMLTGAEPATEKDADLNSILTALQQYVYPKMPLSNYTESDRRVVPQSIKKKPMDM
jgi:hypothetical protein